MTNHLVQCRWLRRFVGRGQVSNSHYRLGGRRYGLQIISYRLAEIWIGRLQHRRLQFRLLEFCRLLLGRRSGRLMSRRQHAALRLDEWRRRDGPEAWRLARSINRRMGCGCSACRRRGLHGSDSQRPRRERGRWNALGQHAQKGLARGVRLAARHHDRLIAPRALQRPAGPVVRHNQRVARGAFDPQRHDFSLSRRLPAVNVTEPADLRGRQHYPPVPEEGLEPTRPYRTLDFESSASAIPPLWHARAGPLARNTPPAWGQKSRHGGCCPRVATASTPYRI